MLDMYLYETAQLIEQLEQCILNSEKTVELEAHIDEIFRIMHTIKGNSAMMFFQNISDLAHSMEDLFDYIRNSKINNVDYSGITDIVLKGIDYINTEIGKIRSGAGNDGEQEALVAEIRTYLSVLQTSNGAKDNTMSIEAGSKPVKYGLPPEDKTGRSEKNTYNALIHFNEDCEMEDIRAFIIVNNLKEISSSISYEPEDIIENPKAVDTIKQQGFKITFESELNPEEARGYLEKTAFIKELQFNQVSGMAEKHEKVQILLDEEELRTVKEDKPRQEEFIPAVPETKPEGQHKTSDHKIENTQSRSKLEQYNQHIGTGSTGMISVNVTKLDELMDLVGELVISEAMVIGNPELAGLNLDSFYKAARQLKKITNELQDNIMSIRMVALGSTFQKMNRLVRDMSRKTGKEVKLELIGQDTEVDKNIIEHIGDPLMHLIRNSIDHGIEEAKEREAKGKDRCGKITLEARNSGGDVWIIIKDDGRGLDRDKILSKALEHGLTKKSGSELTDKEIYSFIFLPGFSTKDSVTEFSGRGVGMDVVQKNIDNIRGSIYVDSIRGEGTTISIKIPLTLSIIDGMTVKVGGSRYTIPITSIKESLRIDKEEIIRDMEGNEAVMLRGQSVPITRLYKLFGVATEVTELKQGIIVIVENDGRTICLFADELIGEQQVVVKSMPKYIKKVKGIAGCTILGDGGISLIMDIADLLTE